MIKGEQNFDDVNTRNYHSQHCDSCVNIKQCLKSHQFALRNQLIKANGDQTAQHIRCPIISCPHKCQSQFHACKQGEHELLCGKVIVPCINAHYGCPFRIRRTMRGSHLARCPASVVVCTVEWNRKPLFPGSTQPFKHKQSHLDVAALNCDKATLREFNSSLPISLRSVLKTPTNKHPIMPLGVAGNRIPNCIIEQAQIERNSQMYCEDREGDDCDESDEDDDDRGSYEYSVEGKTKAPPGLQDSVCSQLKITPSVLNTSKEKSRKVVGVKESEQELSLVIDVITKHSGRYLNWYTFMCAREFRRDEFCDHFRNVHTEISTQLNGWLFKRCPMACFGCPFGIEHMFPAMESPNSAPLYKIQYNESMESFCFTQDLPMTENAEDVTSSATTRLHELPFEILMQLTKYLDPLSLNSLSMAHARLRKVCASVVSFRGIIVFDWEKSQESGKWSATGNTWLFSSAFSPIRKWRFEEVGRISNHLMMCPYYNAQKYLPDKPFAYPVKDSDL